MQPSTELTFEGVQEGMERMNLREVRGQKKEFHYKTDIGQTENGGSYVTQT